MKFSWVEDFWLHPPFESWWRTGVIYICTFVSPRFASFGDLLFAYRCHFCEILYGLLGHIVIFHIHAVENPNLAFGLNRCILNREFSFWRDLNVLKTGDCAIIILLMLSPQWLQRPAAFSYLKRDSIYISRQHCDEVIWPSFPCVGGGRLRFWDLRSWAKILLYIPLVEERALNQVLREPFSQVVVRPLFRLRQSSWDRCQFASGVLVACYPPGPRIYQQRFFLRHDDRASVTSFSHQNIPPLDFCLWQLVTSVPNFFFHNGIRWIKFSVGILKLFHFSGQEIGWLHWRLLWREGGFANEKSVNSYLWFHEVNLTS